MAGRGLTSIFVHGGRACPLLACVVALALAGSASAGDGLAPKAEPDGSNPNVRYDQNLGTKIPLDTRFIDENENEVTLAQCVDGKPTILMLVWYQCPGLCGEVLNGVVEACRKMKLTCGVDFNIITLSVDPKEKPGMALAKKRNFVTLYGRKEADTGWKFLTGKKENIALVTDAAGFRFEFDKMLQEYKHPSGIVILTPDGVISRYLPGIEYIDRGEDGQVIKDETRTLRLSLVEAGEGKTGELTDRLFLSCFRFDVHKGKYSANVLMLMRGAGLLTLLIVIGVYARTSWKVPGVRVLVVCLLAYVALLPVIMFSAMPVNSLP
ncbi:MAG TPA: SCO family protein, partial [Gemmataceae bacterium]|nr:SCO family protein [Gemmataceae bacterium]